MWLIDANEFYKQLEEIRMEYLEEDTLSSNLAAEVIETVMNCYLMDAPTIEADVVPVRHGRWVHDGQRFTGGVDWYHCSECLHPESGIYVKRPFCSMCGAKMDLDV